MDPNTYQGSAQQQIGQLLAEMHERINRLELQDRLSRVHPITGDADFVGTVIRTPDGVPVFVVSEGDGLELPGLAATISAEDSFHEAQSMPFFGTDWEGIWNYYFVGVLTTGVELNMRVNGSSSITTTKYDFRLRSFTIGETYGNQAFVSTSATFQTAASQTHVYEGVWRWEPWARLGCDGCLGCCAGGPIRRCGQQHDHCEDAQVRSAAIPEDDGRH